MNSTYNYNTKLKVALILRNGGEYTSKHVNNLTKLIKTYLTVEHELVLLTDNTTGVNMKFVDRVEKFKHYPTTEYSSKIELFRNDLFNECQVIYLGLNTFIVNNIDNICKYYDDFTELHYFFLQHCTGNEILYWDAQKMHHVYDTSILNQHK